MARRTEEIERDIHRVLLAQSEALRESRDAAQREDFRTQKNADTRLKQANSQLSKLRDELNAARAQAAKAKSARR